MEINQPPPAPHRFPCVRKVNQLMLSKQRRGVDELPLSSPLGGYAAVGLGGWFKMQERSIAVQVTIYLSVYIFLLYRNSCCLEGLVYREILKIQLFLIISFAFSSHLERARSVL